MTHYNLENPIAAVNFENSLDFEPTFDAVPEVWRRSFDDGLAEDVVDADLFGLKDGGFINDEDAAREIMLAVIREQWKTWIKDNN